MGRTEIKTWHASLTSAIITFVIFIMLMKLYSAEWFKKEMPNDDYCVVSIALLFSAIIFILMGIMFYFFKIDFDKREKDAIHLTDIQKFKL